ncbi:MAG: putative ABC transporter permease [Firmicutes bacterium]|nr:putative ABC transporter permease [Bacillota bacterium]
MEICKWFLCFTLFSYIGWAYELVYYSIQQRKPVNSGFLNGCICPIYGIGGLLIWLFLGNIKNPFIIFSVGMVLTTVLEYFVSWFLEKLFKKRWWDYTGWPLNINGRVCIIGAAVFGIMAVAEVKVIAPAALYFIGLMPSNIMRIAAGAVAILILADIAVTIKNSDNFNDKLWYVREQTKIFEENGIGGRMISAVNHRLTRKTVSGCEISDMPDDRDNILERIKRFLHIN